MADIRNILRAFFRGYDGDSYVFVARDNPKRAMFFGYEMISETGRLRDFQSSVAWFPNTETNREVSLIHMHLSNGDLVLRSAS
jgi:hypothetical protein